MKKPLFVVLTLALLPACRTAAPTLEPSAETSPELDAYVGELRILRHPADKARVQLDARSTADAACAVAVRVRSARRERDRTIFSLETLGVPRVAARRVDCRRLVPALDLVLVGTPPAGEIDAVLQTSEAYLEAHGLRCEPPAGLPAAAEVACRETFATHAERRLAGDVNAWPEPLLSIDVWQPAAAKTSGQAAEIELQAVVDTAGRLEQPRLKTPLSKQHEDALLRSLALWRLTPARRAAAPIAARVTLRPVLRTY